MIKDLQSFAQAWKDWIIPLLTGGFLPWQDHVSSFALLPSYYQPSAAIAATIISIISVIFMSSVFLYRLTIPLTVFAFTFCALFIICAVWIGFCLLSLGEWWHPIGFGLAAARFLWVTSYIVGILALTQIFLLCFLMRRSHSDR